MFLTFIVFIINQWVFWLLGIRRAGYVNATVSLRHQNALPLLMNQSCASTKLRDQRLAMVHTPRNTSHPKLSPPSKSNPARQAAYFQADLEQPSCLCAIWQMFIHEAPAMCKTLGCKDREGRGSSGSPSYMVCPVQLFLALRITNYEALKFWWNKNKSFTEKCSEAELFAVCFQFMLLHWK